MARRKSVRAAAPAPVIPGVRQNLYIGVFAEWLDRERVPIPALADELGITASYVRALLRRDFTPSAKLRLRIQARTEGAVPFDCW